MMITVYNGNKKLAVYSNVTGDSNIDGTLRIYGWDDDGDWQATYPPGEWTRIEVDT